MDPVGLHSMKNININPNPNPNQVSLHRRDKSHLLPRYEHIDLYGWQNRGGDTDSQTLTGWHVWRRPVPGSQAGDDGWTSEGEPRGAFIATCGLEPRWLHPTVDRAKHGRPRSRAMHIWQETGIEIKLMIQVNKATLRISLIQAWLPTWNNTSFSLFTK